MKNRAVFLDRDGVIIENCDAYVRSWQDVFVYPQALAALKRLAGLKHKIILVTNQSVVGRGIITLEAAQMINRKLVYLVEQAGGRIDDVFMCPHAPLDKCHCRKPEAGLILAAAKKHQIDLSMSIMIGDALTDIEAGQRAGIAKTGLVRTGRGMDQQSMPEAKRLLPFAIFDDLSSALLALVDDMDKNEVK